jgi:glycerol-3-phosphate dehydrogenase
MPLSPETGLPATTAARIHALYGRYAGDVMAIARAEPGMARPLAAGCPTVGAEIAHAARNEMVHTLADAVLRRTNLGSAGDPGRDAVQAAAAILARELGWSAERSARETEDVLACYPRFTGELGA